MTTADFQPFMSVDEISLLRKFTPKGGNVLEFGSGGSTQLFFECGAKYLCSVDSDPDWLKKLTGNPEVRVYYKHGRWTPIHANIGPVGRWGAPAEPVPTSDWLNYTVNCWDIIPEIDYDFALIDGRFRVASVCQVLLRCGDLPIAVHDFWERPWYHVVLPYLKLLERVDSLGVFRPAPGLNRQDLDKLLQAHLYVFD
ncbi:MAG: hypothetical protein LBV80_05440 [Deltaproteobacteria bacterium]|jgi:hypothetical protein|nr:hypothetical protein [Deltaproteobacteria bacterium]